ncbi:MAG TPA: protein-L-isoaspartate O-methyltransferase [Steroidobacteraceae bacterium]|nr:protein-L-isoaspartate O-methyltransferase [Steroidobacteraceae bacterium]
MMSTELAREQMVGQQVRAWDVLSERVLSTLRALPRELFVPQSQQHLAYADIAVPLAHGQHMLRPVIAGRLLQALALTGTERVLEIGTGSGFLCACLAANAASVRSLEILPDLAEAARSSLAAAGVRNAEVVTADAVAEAAAYTAGDAAGDPGHFDAVVLTASLPVYDPRFARALKVGGRLLAAVGTAPVMEVCLVQRMAQDTWQRSFLFETVLDPLLNAVRPEAFSFF